MCCMPRQELLLVGVPLKRGERDKVVRWKVLAEVSWAPVNK